MIFIIYANGLVQPKAGRVHAMNYGINLNRDMLAFLCMTMDLSVPSLQRYSPWSSE